ncbi:MAG TPA: hypothetical protein DCX17_01015 [Firmicutes bacterium]|jgi:cell fate (sporulation/competence/biofilm development) regulator YlbF (YheA/YmcA/DUF963 family)|nr:hypothetical protein [Bacillota bacterium]
MTDFEKALLELKEGLFDVPEVKTFFSLRDQIQNDPDLMKLDKQKRDAQQEMAKAINDDAQYFVKKQQYLQLEQTYDSHPLIVNYKQVKAEVRALLEQIVDILSTE